MSGIRNLITIKQVRYYPWIFIAVAIPDIKVIKSGDCFQLKEEKEEEEEEEEEEKETLVMEARRISIASQCELLRFGGNAIANSADCIRTPQTRIRLFRVSIPARNVASASPSLRQLLFLFSPHHLQ